MYQRAGVLEYLAVLLEEQRVEWRRLDAGHYRMLVEDSAGVLKSETFPGLWLDTAAFWAGDSNRMLNVLQQGLASPEALS